MNTIRGKAGAGWRGRLARMSRLAVTLLVAAGLAGCASNRAGSRAPGRPDYSKLQVGMPKQEVLALLGPPTQCATKMEARVVPNKIEEVQREIFQYAEILPRKGGTNFFLVFFDEGKVIDYGPQFGRLRDRVVNVFVAEQPEEETEEK